MSSIDPPLYSSPSLFLPFIFPSYFVLFSTLLFSFFSSLLLHFYFSYSIFSVSPPSPFSPLFIPFLVFFVFYISSIIPFPDSVVSLACFHSHLFAIVPSLCPFLSSLYSLLSLPIYSLLFSSFHSFPSLSLPLLFQFSPISSSIHLSISTVLFVFPFSFHDLFFSFSSLSSLFLFFFSVSMILNFYFFLSSFISFLFLFLFLFYLPPILILPFLSSFPSHSNLFHLFFSFSPLFSIRLSSSFFLLASCTFHGLAFLLSVIL